MNPALIATIAFSALAFILVQAIHLTGYGSRAEAVVFTIVFFLLGGMTGSALCYVLMGAGA